MIGGFAHRRVGNGGLAALGASVLALTLCNCGVAVEAARLGIDSLRNSEVFHQGRHGELSEQELEWAKIAWKYFENNLQESTGLVNSMDRYGATTMWCVGDYLAALTAAEVLGLVDKQELDERLSSLIGFLNRMELFAGRIPNKLYATNTGVMVGYSLEPEELGWSALDLGRLLVWLATVAERYPQYSEYIQRAVLRWNFCDVIDRCGSLYGGVRVNGEIELFQEGRLGYEEYAAMGFKAWGFSTRRASLIEPYEKVTIHGVDIYHDARDPRESGTFAPVVSLPPILMGLEFNWDHFSDHQSRDSFHSDAVMADLAQRIYRVQEARYENERILTARTDHPLATAPFFVYDSIFAAGYPWNTIGDTGEVFPNAALVSSRATFGMWALWKTPYTDRLLESVCTLFDRDRGWFEGRYERTGDRDKSISCTTNALVLESLLYKQTGSLYRPPTDPTYLSVQLGKVFEHPGRCFPPRQRSCEGEP